MSGSYPDVEKGANLHWGAGERLVFLAYLDDWPHLYSVAAAGGTPTLLTPGAFMVEHVTETRDRRFMVYDANTGTTQDDGERRHLFRVPVDHPGAAALTSGETLRMGAGCGKRPDDRFRNGERTTATVSGHRGNRRPASSGACDSALPPDFPVGSLVTPKAVTFKAEDGTLVHGQLFEAKTSSPGGHGASKPGIIFVHGGPPRQMLLGWHYMQYYSNAYAVNQYLVAHGFTVLSVNYRLGIGYGRAFQQPDHAGPAGAAEYQDVVAGARFLQTVPGVDSKRIGIWGGSYGGLLTALALARNSDLFAAGVDLHGVHDWSRLMDELLGHKQETRYEKGDREEATKVAWESSPDASVEGWKSPVLLIRVMTTAMYRFSRQWTSHAG